jgi:hypothetical protein
MFKRRHHPAEAPGYAMCFDPGTIIGIGLTAAASMMRAKATAAAGEAEQRAGKARQKSLKHQAKQARQNAGQERASAQRAAIEKRREARYLSSRALALAAKSGGGTGGSAAVILGDIGAEGEFRALTEMYTGEERAKHLETQADSLIFEGNQERIAGDIRRRSSKSAATSQLITAAATGLSRYG